MSRIPYYLAISALVAIPTYAAAETPGSALITSLTSCRELQQEPARLACYDEAVGALINAIDSGSVAFVDHEQIRNVRRSLFGFSGVRIPFLTSRSDGSDEEPKEVVTVLSSLSPIGFDRYRITVEEGNAVWETTDSAPLGRQTAGTAVTIRRGAVGGYFVRVGRERWVRARRVR